MHSHCRTNKSNQLTIVNNSDICCIKTACFYLKLLTKLFIWINHLAYYWNLSNLIDSKNRSTTTIPRLRRTQYSLGSISCNEILTFFSINIMHFYWIHTFLREHNYLHVTTDEPSNWTFAALQRPASTEKSYESIT